MITVRGLSKSFRGFAAVKEIDLDIYKGEVFGFLGPNGAGKSTTINMLSTLLKPSAGQAVVAGYDVIAQPAQVRRSIGLVFQDPSLDELLTAEENLYFHALLYGLDRAVREQRTAQVLEMVELTERSRDVVKTFSGGMKRRLEIARGLLHHPQVLFLDEPTLGLDPQTRSHIWQYIHELREREQITIFLTTHYMDEAENCDRIAIIDHGKIAALDTPAGLKQLVGGDIVWLATGDDRAAARAITEKFGLAAQAVDGVLQVEVKHGESFIPRLIEALPCTIREIGLRKPTLDDVFLKLTGRAIRPEEAGAREQMRYTIRAWRRRR